jgi:hypothetical protein
MTSPVAAPSDKFFLGEMVPYNINRGPLSMDELVIWNRVLRPVELALIFRQPGLLVTALDGLPRPVPNKPSLTLSLHISKAVDAVVEPGEVFRATTVATSRSSVPIRVYLQASLRDFWSNRFKVIMTNVSNNTWVLMPNSSTTILLTVQAPTIRSPYSLDLSGIVDDGHSTRHLSTRSVASFAVWPQPHRSSPRCTSTENWFGSHISPNGCRYGVIACPQGSFVAQARRLGQCGPVRDHDFLQSTKFNFVEPVSNDFAFKGSDSIRLLTAAGYGVLGNLAQTPEWAANRSGVRADGVNVSAPCPGSSLCHPPRVEAFANYLNHTIYHYENISSYELGNEPSGGEFWGGTVDQYTAIAKTARLVIDRIAAAGGPNVKLWIGAFGGYGAEAYQETLAKAGALQYADALSFHLGPQICAAFGCTGRFDTAEWYSALLNRSVKFFGNLSRHYTSHSGLALFDTEGGSEGTTFLLGLGETGAGLPPSRCLPPLNFRSSTARTVFGEALMQVLGVQAHYYYYQADYVQSDCEYAWTWTVYGLYTVASFIRQHTMRSACTE